MKHGKKSLDSLAEKLYLNWPYSPALPQQPKFKFYFPAKESKDFLAGFIEKCAFNVESPPQSIEKAPPLRNVLQEKSSNVDKEGFMRV